ncbi:MAG: hypothetical protein IPG84_12860 [Betaproteobacteria bacterium]|nr:hypothetical protein [Betaproteobacteria bacterium]
MIRTLALITLLAGFALGALAQLGEAPGLVPWSFGAAVAALVLWLAGSVARRADERRRSGGRCLRRRSCGGDTAEERRAHARRGAGRRRRSGRVGARPAAKRRAPTHQRGAATTR